MSHVFNHLDLIEEVLRQSPFGLVIDVDGTISRTVPTPQQAEVSPVCLHYLSILCNHLALVAAISGRPAIQVKDMIKIDKVVYIGNHGLERWTEGHSEFSKYTQGYPAIIKAVIEELAPLLSVEGISIENKGVTATIHYRLCPDPQLVKRNILTAIKSSPQAKSLRIIQGRKSINLLPPVKVDKGTAVADLIQEYDLQGGIYLGDDITDIAAFKAIRAASRDSGFRGFAIGIISQEMPENLAAEADFTLNGVADVERFLGWMSQTIVKPS